MFQFPSNGKVYPKSDRGSLDTRATNVSIPFKRESVSKGGTIGISRRHSTDCFNSLQTGKCIQSQSRIQSRQKHRPGFQFPSNGKVYPKWWRVFGGHADTRSFNSLQTGKCIQSVLTQDEQSWFVFQFPSNGKVYPKWHRSEHRPIEPNRYVSIPFKRESVSKV